MSLSSYAHELAWASLLCSLFGWSAGCVMSNCFMYVFMFVNSIVVCGACTDVKTSGPVNHGLGSHFTNTLAQKHTHSSTNHCGFRSEGHATCPRS